MIDSYVLPFEVRLLGIRGRIVRLGSVIDEILAKHDYPVPVSAMLAKSVALASILGTSLKFQGKFILQTKTNGPVSMIVADFASPNGVRGIAKFNAHSLAKANTEAAMLGVGHLVMTVDQGVDMERYQGIVPLGDGTLTDAAHTYFQQSEQIPTRLRLAAAPMQLRGDKSQHWMAGAIFIQHLPREGGISPLQFSSGDAPAEDNQPSEDDDWVKARILLETVEDHELLDPTLPSEDLLYRLYHEDGVTVFPPIELTRHCTCSRETVASLLRGFTVEERTDMIKDGQVVATCEFCSTVYTFTPSEAGAS